MKKLRGTPFYHHCPAKPKHTAPRLKSCAKAYQARPQGIPKLESSYIHKQCWLPQNRPWRIPVPFDGLTAKLSCLPRTWSSDQTGKRQDFFLTLVYWCGYLPDTEAPGIRASGTSLPEEAWDVVGWASLCLTHYSYLRSTCWLTDWLNKPVLGQLLWNPRPAHSKVTVSAILGGGGN